MIVNDLHIVGVPVVPDETDAILIVDSNAVLAAKVALCPAAGRMPVARTNGLAIRHAAITGVRNPERRIDMYVDAPLHEPTTPRLALEPLLFGTECVVL